MDPVVDFGIVLMARSAMLKFTNGMDPVVENGIEKLFH